MGSNGGILPGYQSSMMFLDHSYFIYEAACQTEMASCNTYTCEYGGLVINPLLFIHLK